MPQLGVIQVFFLITIAIKFRYFPPPASMDFLSPMAYNPAVPGSRKVRVPMADDRGRIIIFADCGYGRIHVL